MTKSIQTNQLLQKTRNVFSVLALIIISLTVLTSCGRYYTGEVAGYVRNSDSDAGVNDATVRFYLTQPAEANSSGFFTQTASAPSGGNDGYYSHSIIWLTSEPTFSDEGDSEAIWLGITHEDYYSKVVKIEGVLSGTLNFLPAVKLDPAFFDVEEIKGRVVDGNGNPINGVRVVLDLNSTTDNDEDYAVNTAALEGDAGYFVFQNVRWDDKDKSGSDASKTENASIIIDDQDYRLKTGNSVAIVLRADQNQEVNDTNVVQTTFTATNITGKVVNTNGEPMNGIRMILDLNSTITEDEDYIANTNAEGVYTFANVNWENENPATDTTDTELVRIRVSDEAYVNVSGADNNITFSITSNLENEAPVTFTVKHKPRTEFSTNIQGQCLYRQTNRNGEEVDKAIQGVDVILDFTDDNGTHTFSTQTNNQGEFTFYLQWQDTTPESDSNSSIPSGEDIQVITITYSEGNSTGNMYKFFNGSPQTYTVKSWLDPFILPEAIDTNSSGN